MRHLEAGKELATDDGDDEKQPTTEEGSPFIAFPERERGKYPWVISDCDPKAYRLNSGLFIASRYPLRDPEFVRYSSTTTKPKTIMCEKKKKEIV